MHSQSANHEFRLATLAVLIILCLCVTTDTPKALLFLAGAMVIAGLLGWYYSKDLESPPPWAIRLVSTILLILGIAFLVWYIQVGHTLLRPLVDGRKIFETFNQALVTPKP